jgi:hypothetical protein
LSRCRHFAQILPILIASLGAITLQPTLRAQAPAAVLDSKEVLAKAKAAYYNLSARGFKQYTFQATPDWSYLLGDLAKTNPAGFDAAMKVFAKVRFEVVVDAAGAAKITHNSVETPNDQMKAGMNQVYSGMDQMLTGFFQTWNPFMIETPFSSVGSALKLVDTGSNYQVQWVEGKDTRVDILMDGTFAVTEMKVSTPQFDSVIRPVFDRLPGGLVLASYEATYQEPSPAPKIRVVVLIKNKLVQGLLVPSDLDLTAWVGDNKTHILVAFTGANILKK